MKERGRVGGGRGGGREVRKADGKKRLGWTGGANGVRSVEGRQEGRKGRKTGRLAGARRRAGSRQAGSAGLFDRARSYWPPQRAKGDQETGR